ncbi:MAG: efflux RND transporter permease subunit [Saprospirales bacterium]|nr:MAG: efflux RND transporter permease subunit [Saprospirales bacterium]
MLSSLVRFCLDNKLIVGLLLLGLIIWGLIHSPFDTGIDILPKDPIAVDAIPNLGENQQIIFTEWAGRSPQDIEDQITYPLSTALLGLSGVREVRSNSMFGFSSIYVIFEEGVEFYWSRARLLEKLNSLPAGLLPAGVQPALGPDATALGQIFWYTLEGRDSNGNPTGGWSLEEIRSIQDFQVGYALAAVEGVAEVASVGGHVKEYLVEADPQKMRQYDISLLDLRKAVAESNLDIGAQTMEINQVEYFIRGLGYVQSLEDIEKAVIRSTDQQPIVVGDVARVSSGPATRRGALDKSGAEVAGGVVVAAYGSNPMQVIENVKSKIEDIAPSLPSKTLADGTTSQLEIVPFYDRSELIRETIGTLEEALLLQIIITTIVILLLLLSLKASILVAGVLPVSVLFCFIAMKAMGIEANIVALTGIAIAIGTMVDMSIVLVESIVHKLERAGEDSRLFNLVYDGTREVGSAVLTAVATTVISFLPVFTMVGAEGKMFTPLAYTKTFALIAAITLTLFVVPPAAQRLYSKGKNGPWLTHAAHIALIILGVYGLINGFLYWPALVLLIGAVGIGSAILIKYFPSWKQLILRTTVLLYAVWITFILTQIWMPLGVEQGLIPNFIFAAVLICIFYGFSSVVIYYYEHILRFLLKVPWLFFALIIGMFYGGFQVYKSTQTQFLPDLDEGSFLLMPTSMPHSGMEENMRNLRLLDMAVSAIPEVEMVVGKLGRVESPLDPAPISMYENVIIYKPEFKLDERGRRLRFAVDGSGEFKRDSDDELIPDRRGKYYRNWRDEIRSPDDIWSEISRVTNIPGITAAPKLQPIETRLVMLQTGMRAPMGIKVRGPDLETIEEASQALEEVLRNVEGVNAPAVFAERVVGKPYLHINIDRDEIARHGLSIQTVQAYIQTAIGGAVTGTTVEGRERYNIRVRYPRELRSHPVAIEEVLVRTPGGAHIPLKEIASLEYVQGPQSIKSENGFLVSYVLFDRESGYGEFDVVDRAKRTISEMRSHGELTLPDGIYIEFAGNYQQQIRANERLAIAVPLALGLIFIILYLQFRSTPITLMVFSGVAVAFAGGFLMIGLYNMEGFLDFSVWGSNMRDVFNIQTVYLSVAVWVGFLALFGIATDDGVLMATFLRDSFRQNTPQTLEELKEAVVKGGLRRVRPAMMTTATTLLALLPVLSSTGKGADVMIPMAIPTFGGMMLQIVTMFTVPLLFYIWKSYKMK